MSIRGRDFLTLQDFTQGEIWLLLKTSRRLKEETIRRPLHPLLSGKILAMIFQRPSTRTRVSFDVAMKRLGGLVVDLSWEESQLGRGESIADTARVLDRFVDGVMARVQSHGDLEEMARHADIPVINGLSDFCHPCQILADLLTIWEKKGELKGLKLVYVGDGNNVCNSLLIGCSKVGMNISVACPDEYMPYEKAVRWALENAQESGSKVEITNDPYKAVEDADVIYTDTFISMGMEAEREKRLRAFMPRYQVNTDLFKYAAEDAVFMHCLPANRGEEVSPEVIDGPRSIVWDQAENRLHIQKGLLTLIL